MKRSPEAQLSILLALSLTLAGTVSAQDPDTDWIDYAALDAGEIVLRTDKGGRGTVLIDVAVQIDAPREIIWDILAACEIAPEYVPNVVACSRIDSIDDGRSELFIQTVKPAFFVPKFEHVFRLDYDPPNRIGVQRVSGPIDTMDGAWWLLDHNDGILLMHTLTLKPGIPVPRMFVRATLKRDLPVVLEAVRDRAELLAARAPK